MSDRHEIDHKLVELVAGLSVDECRARLAKMPGRVGKVLDRAEQLYDERALLFKRLLDAGDRQADIARMAKVTPMAVSFAVEKRVDGSDEPATAATG